MSLMVRGAREGLREGGEGLSLGFVMSWEKKVSVDSSSLSDQTLHGVSEGRWG